MLDCTGDTDCKVNLRANRLTGLADLERLRLPACIDNRTGAGNLSAENLCELVENLEVLGAAHTAAAGDQDLRVHDIDRITDLLHDLEDVHIAIVRLEARVELDKLITPGRTVAICGRLFGQAIVAIVLPPNAGRVMRSWLCFWVSSLPAGTVSGKLPISSCVQSAVRPVSTRAEVLGPRSRPIAVAPIRTISGLNLLMTSESACVYGSVL